MNPLDRQLRQAVEDFNFPLVESLVTQGANLNAFSDNPDDESMFAHVVLNQHLILSSMIQLGADPDEHVSQTGTPLIYAVWRLDYRLISVLLSIHRVDPNGIGFLGPGGEQATALDAAYMECNCMDAPGAELVIDGIVALLKAYGGKTYEELLMDKRNP